MLNENDVIDAVVKHIEAHGYKVLQKQRTTERGPDIVAVLPSGTRRIRIEAKGDTSADKNSKNFGNPFSASQANSHVAVGLFQAAKLLGRFPDDEVALAFPDNARHRARVNAVAVALERLDVRVFFVAEDRTVCILGRALTK